MKTFLAQISITSLVTIFFLNVSSYSKDLHFIRGGTYIDCQQSEFYKKSCYFNLVRKFVNFNGNGSTVAYEISGSNISFPAFRDYASWAPPKEIAYSTRYVSNLPGSATSIKDTGSYVEFTVGGVDPDTFIQFSIASINPADIGTLKEVEQCIIKINLNLARSLSMSGLSDGSNFVRCAP